MLIARAPVRISLAGGGTDLSAYYERFGGLVVGTAIAKYFYAFIEVSGRPGVQISSADYGTFYHHEPGTEMAWDGDLSLPRAVLHQFGVTSGVDLFLASEIPPGTGLGSSSAATVALVKGFTTLLGESPSKQEAAEAACAIEIDKLRMPIGKQDQYFAAFGGLNAITFGTEGTTVLPLVVSAETRRALESNLLLFFTGSAHHSAHILAEQRQATARQSGTVVEALHHIKRLAERTISALESGQPDRVGELLQENWMYKKQLASGITNSAIDESYDTARAHGALGGKITGAGGGGFLMLYCPLERQARVTAALEARGLRRMLYHFDSVGARVLVNSGLNLGRDQLAAASAYRSQEHGDKGETKSGGDGHA
jgi:D-glycero-alpha-D-manno-heptose-7-phosphate kinase